MIDGVRVGELDHVRWTPKKPKPGHHHAGLKPPTEEEMEALAELQRLEAQAIADQKRRELMKLNRTEWAQVRGALRSMAARDKSEAKALERLWRIRRGEIDKRGRKLEYPFGPPVPKPPKPVPAEPIDTRKKPRLWNWGDGPRPLGLPQPGEILRFPTPKLEPVEPKPVRLIDKFGNEFLVPLETYERYGREAIPLGVDPPVWVLYRLGLGWNE